MCYPVYASYSIESAYPIVASTHSVLSYVILSTRPVLASLCILFYPTYTFFSIQSTHPVLSSLHTLFYLQGSHGL